MADFRCEKCGKLLSVDAGAGTSFRCPQCRARLLVPAGLAALPSPRIAGDNLRAGEAAGRDEAEQVQHEEKLFGVLAYGMPWVISAFMHVGIFLMAMFVVFIVAAAQPVRTDITIPDAVFNTENPGGVMNPGGGGDPNIKAAAPVKGTSPGLSRRESKIANYSSEASGNIPLIGLDTGGTGGGGGAFDIGPGGGGSVGIKSNFYGSGGGNVHQVVYVIDRSGSMIDTFDYLRKEMLTSIGQLKDPQDFHVIFYSDGPPMENPPRQLIQANKANRLMAAEFLKGITPERQTDPVPALKRAFDVLQGARKQGKLIYLLSDGLFPDNNAVLKLIAERNPPGNGQVVIHTFLYGDRPKEAEEVMKKIADQNKGRYRYVNPEE
ncbi:MAG: VWA domain-containing protein [Planctomycetes bacterium]|nr:VWA domain-containing protein [Planctomycetota bacterium]